MSHSLKSSSQLLLPLTTVRILWEKQGWPWEERIGVINILRVGPHQQHLQGSEQVLTDFCKVKKAALRSSMTKLSLCPGGLLNCV